MLEQAHIILICLFAGSAVNHIQAQDDLQSLVKKVRPAVVSVVAYDKNGDILSRGSGFFVGSTGIAGTGQVLTRRSLLPIEAARTEARTSDGQSYKIAGVLDENKEADLAIISVEFSERKIEPLTISEAIPVIDQRVIVIYGSALAEPAMIEGAVSAIQDSSAGKMVQVSGQIPVGSAGSPVINMKGEVVGVVRLQKENESVFSANVGDALLKLIHPVFQPPTLLNNPEPRYTREARDSGIEGDVLVRVLIGVDGLVKRVVVVKGLPGGLTDQAINAASKLKFKPATRNGRPVMFWKPVLIEFRLKR
jgi:TonB family protein